MTREIPRLPFEPLRRVVASRCVMRQCREPGASLRDGLSTLWREKSWQYRSYARAKVEGELTIFAADRIAIDLGLHPALIWPEWFDIADSPTGGVRRAS